MRCCKARFVAKTYPWPRWIASCNRLLAIWLRRCEASEHPAESEKDPATVSIVAEALTQGMANAFKTEKELENSLAVFKVCSTMTTFSHVKTPERHV
jgi:hypothetical protein